MRSPPICRQQPAPARQSRRNGLRGRGFQGQPVFAPRNRQSCCGTRRFIPIEILQPLAQLVRGNAYGGILGHIEIGSAAETIDGNLDFLGDAPLGLADNQEVEQPLQLRGAAEQVAGADTLHFRRKGVCRQILDWGLGHAASLGPAPAFRKVGRQRAFRGRNW